MYVRGTTCVHRGTAMISNMLLLSPLCFLLCWMLPVDSMRIRVSFTSRLPIGPRLLNMAPGAFDDMYFGCNHTMTQMVEKKYFKKENTGAFWDVWEKASDCANRNLNHTDAGDEALTKDHMQAICVYTSDYKKFYWLFNDAVRTNKENHEFPYHSLHFWLTSAMQILNENNKCHTTYRRSDLKFVASVNKVIRFGSFTSSSKKSNLDVFGRKTCFKITTCSGAYLKHYSAFKGEAEVLIPPYEMFKVTDVKKGRDVAQLSDCEDVYMLESVGVHSNMNCRAVN
ncbi:Erythroblast NAD(P)(+)--arginine ADP-ribosyltransferase [Channa argus]|uniref:NAD(P)(+)--arginine ADP-ribosyltransferase n=1 Tax=Channa argus TaxID=215402 RepID=A0A6G1Q7W5_CHAAH|nr:Erythroblast NAD(P)(+)--arginine ADP-ribosyltransferase [Channa argus]